VARALIGRIEGDEVALEAPGGTHEFEVLEVRYE
jgi:transcription elongation factor GreA